MACWLVLQAVAQLLCVTGLVLLWCWPVPVVSQLVVFGISLCLLCKHVHAQAIRVTCLHCVSLPVCAVEGSAASQRPHYLVLINPKSGKELAEVTFRNHVQPLFDIAEITYDIVVTSELLT